MRRNVFHLYFNQPGPDGGAGGGAGAPSIAPSPSPAPPSPAPSLTPSPSPAPAGGTPPAAPPQRFEYDEDRSEWIDPKTHRALIDRHATADYNAQLYRRMLEAAGNFKLPGPQTPEDARMEEARGYLRKLMPELALLDQVKELLPQIQQMRQQFPSVQSSAQQYWERVGYQTVQELHGEVAKLYGIGADKLSDDFKSDVGEAFMRFIQSDEKKLDRYYRNDPSLLKEFVTRWQNLYVDPVRRQTQAPAARIAQQNRALPAAPQAGAPPAPAPPAPPQSEDEVHNRAFDAFAAMTGARR